MGTVTKGKGATYIKTLIGIAFMYFFGLVCPTFGGMSQMGIKILGVFIGLIFMTCVGCDLFSSSLLALLAFVLHGYYKASELISGWIGSGVTFQLIFAGALCVYLRQTGAMDVFAKKLLSLKITRGRPGIFMFMLMLAGFLVSTVVNGAAFFLLVFGLFESIAKVCGYKKDDQFMKFGLLYMYTSSYGKYLIPFQGLILVVVGFFDSMLEPYGYQFNRWLYMVIQIVTWVSLFAVLVLCMKYLFKVDISRLKDIKSDQIEQFNKTPDTFSFEMKIGIGSFVFCMAYLFLIYLLPKSFPGYTFIKSLDTSLIWAVPLAVFNIISKNGKPIMNAPALLRDASIWPMVALIGAMTMLGRACTDASLGINNWLVSVFAPVFGGQSTIMLLLICVVFITVVTQVVNGNVLTMGMTPIIVPIVCGMMEQGIKIDPTVTLTVISTCASVAFLFPSGSVAAAYILGREEIDKKFLFTKGVAVLAVYMLVQLAVAILFNAIV